MKANSFLTQPTYDPKERLALYVAAHLAANMGQQTAVVGFTLRNSNRGRVFGILLVVAQRPSLNSGQLPGRIG